jgi:UDP-glucose 4-epimerase
MGHPALSFLHLLPFLGIRSRKKSTNLIPGAHQPLRGDQAHGGAYPAGLSCSVCPYILSSLLTGKRELKVFGREYNTPDGTCVRDYIHINDLCDAHLLALSFLEKNDGAHGFNLGIGNGFSVLEMIHSAEQVTGRKIIFTSAPPRSGDPATLVADSTLAMQRLVWQPNAMDWHWHQNQRF